MVKLANTHAKKEIKFNVLTLYLDNNNNNKKSKKRYGRQQDGESRYESEE